MATTVDPRSIYRNLAMQQQRQTQAGTTGMLPDYDPTGRQDASGVNTGAPPVSSAGGGVGDAQGLYDWLYSQAGTPDTPGDFGVADFAQAKGGQGWFNDHRDALLSGVLPALSNYYGGGSGGYQSAYDLLNKRGNAGDVMGMIYNAAMGPGYGLYEGTGNGYKLWALPGYDYGLPATLTGREDPRITANMMLS